MMVQKLLIYGAGGAAKDILRLVGICNKKYLQYEIEGIIVDGYTTRKSFEGYPIVGGHDVVANYGSIGVVIAVGNPQDKLTIYNKIKNYDNVYYPNIIHPSINLENVVLGYGVIIEEGSILTTSIKINNFVTININSTLSHDCEIGDFVTISPGVNIAGNVIIKDFSFIGIGSTVIEKVEIGQSTIVGAGAVVIRDIKENSKVVGVPAVEI